jgi:outer membrane immunogenic protein
VANSYHDDAATFSLPGLDVFGSSSHSVTRVGWTVGAGVEWALTKNWTVRGEYLYVDLGSIDTNARVNIADPPGELVTPNRLNTSFDVIEHIGRIGINYKF